jgi:hypothetical protein
MVHFNSPVYRDATTICNALLADISSPETEPKDRALLAREWLAIAFAKREWRGLPRLKSHTLREVIDAERAERRNITTEALTIQETPEAQTVPTPPEGEAPSPSPVRNDK